MGRSRRLGNIRKIPKKAVEAERRPGGSKAKKYLSSMPAELHLRIVHYLPRTSLPTICQLDKHWRSVGTDELLRWLLPISPCKTKWTIENARELLKRSIGHFINTNNANALQRLLDFRPEHPYFRMPKKPLLQAEPLTSRARVTKDEEERFCLGNDFWLFSSRAVDAAFKFNDMSCMQLLIDHGLTDYSCLLDRAAYGDFSPCYYYGRLPARPIPCGDFCGGHNSVLNWLLAYPPRHVVQAMLIMWMCRGQMLHPRLHSLCDWNEYNSPDYSQRYNMLIMAASRGHPASLQMIDELRMMVEILRDDTFGTVIPEARQPLSRALRIARGMASMWPGTPPLVAEYLQSVCTWEDHQNRSSSRGDSTNNQSPSPSPPLILPPLDPLLYRLIDLKTYDEMLEPESWLELRNLDECDVRLWLVSTEFLADEDAARRMRRNELRLYAMNDTVQMYHVLIVASAFRRWRCVEVVLSELRGRWPDDVDDFLRRDSVLCHAIIDAVHGEPGCADGRIIRKLLRIRARKWEDDNRCRTGPVRPNRGPFQGGWFGWEPFRLAFVEQQQDREQRETQTCMDMRDAVLDSLSISDQDALDFLVGEPSRALYRACKRRLLK